jgi:NADPH:quinone reductase-like Zn-dependent oxidoreductase
LAAAYPLRELAGVRPGETVLVLGGTGAVGQLAIQVARILGANRIIAAGRHGKTLLTTRALGATHLIQLAEPAGTELAVAFRDAAGPSGVHVVLDALFGEPLAAALEACADGARIINIGHLAGQHAPFTATALRNCQATLIGYSGLKTPLSSKASVLTWLAEQMALGEIQIDYEAYELHAVEKAWIAQAESPHHKVVVQM